MAKSIVQLVDNLPEDNITTKVLNALDFVIPGEWVNINGFDNYIQALTGETDPVMVKRIRERAIALYDDKKRGYQGAVSLYQTIDKADAALGVAALADKVGEKIGILSFLQKLTPKADTSQTIDLILKIAVEILAYCKLNGLPSANPQEFVKALRENYQGAALIRMGTLVCIDGLLPLGPDFLDKVHNTIEGSQEETIQQNTAYTVLGSSLPGDRTADKVGFLSQSFETVRDWMQEFIDRTGVTQASVFGQVGKFIQIADDNLDLVAAFLDQTTNYFEHTGIQTVASYVIKDAYTAVKAEMGQSLGAGTHNVEALPGEIAGTTLQAIRPSLRHVQTNQLIPIPDVSIVHLGKPNHEVPPEIDLSLFPDSDVVSRVHANLWFENGEYNIVDVGSSNGTFLNDQLLEPRNRYSLKAGDRLDFGRDQKVSFIFETV